MHYLLQEEELRASGDPKFQHLSEELHVEISAFATPAEAHARIAYALAEVRRFLVPVSITDKFWYLFQILIDRKQLLLITNLNRAHLLVENTCDSFLFLLTV